MVVITAPVNIFSIYQAQTLHIASVGAAAITSDFIALRQVNLVFDFQHESLDLGNDVAPADLRRRYRLDRL